MKTIGTFFMFLLGFQLSFGQTGLEVWENQNGQDVKLPNGALLIRDCSISGEYHLSGLKIKNATTVACSTYCRKAYIDTVPGTLNSFCWNGCYFPNTMVSIYGWNILPQQTYDLFEGHYDPNGHAGTTKVKYTWVDTLNTANQVYIEVEYRAHPLGIFTVGLTNHITIYPNPASTQIWISGSELMTQSERLTLCNPIGAVIREFPVLRNQHEILLDISTLPEGIFIVSLISGNRVIEARKLIIQR